MNGTCGCCAGTEIAVPVSETNAPGRAELVYRAGTYATFFETMLARLTRIPHLRARDLVDPSIALLDAWAVIADVLTFYQERIANEGYLATARERRSVLELANLIGYRARPGVAASVRLAFTVAKGFRGSLPRGTRAQSIPGTGETPQFFETSEALEVRDAWNVLAPRLTRPQTITPPDPLDELAVTGAGVVDTVYLDGIDTNLAPGDALFFVFGSGAGEQVLRIARAVDLQPDDDRTEVTLVLDPRPLNVTLELFLAKARYLFPGSDVAVRVAEILETLRANAAIAADAGQLAALLRGALAQLAVQQALAAARGFTRTTAFLGQLANALDALPATPVVEPRKDGATPPFALLPETLACSPLARLDAIAGSLSRAASPPPASPLRLTRSVARSFTSQSDAAARLIAALNPGAAGALYQGWSGIVTPRTRREIFAARVRATLFASSFAGAPTVTRAGSQSSGTAKTAFDPPSIASAWKSIESAWKLTDGSAGPLAQLALDATYDRITAGSWVAVSRPFYAANDAATAPVQQTSFHVVTAAKTVAMDTRAGLAATVTVLTVDPPWLTEPVALDSELVLRATTVYAQSEKLDLAEEPLDAGVAGDHIDLAGVYDGLAPGRWIIVEGQRTDVAGTAGVPAAELAMIAAVEQGSETPLCAVFPFAAPPLRTIHYITAADVNGDRLVVGEIDPEQKRALAEFQPPAIANQRYCDRVRLGPGCYASAYVPTRHEVGGLHPTFAGMLVHPRTGVPFAGGRIPDDESGLFAWRITDEPLHTILSLANPLAYAYDRRGLRIHGNVADATHGQTAVEVLGDGDAARAFQTFTLSQPPLTYVSALTASGAAGTLSVYVNDVERHEVRDLAAAGPAQRVYVTRQDDAQQTTVVFGDGVHGARLPSGTANVKAAYRYGLGTAGNVAAGAISQLATQPLGAEGVINPLAATGGADADRIEQIRANAPLAVTALDRLVSVRDYADFARTYAGIGKAFAVRLSDGRKQLVHVTVAGTGDVPIDVNSDLYGNLVASLLGFGDPHQPIAVGVRRVKLIVLSAAVGLQRDYLWESVEPQLRAALLARFGFDARELGQTAYLSEAVRAVQDVEGVAFVDVTTFDGIAESVTAAELASLGTTLGLRQYVQAEGARVDLRQPAGSPNRVLAAEVVFMTPEISETLILTEAGT